MKSILTPVIALLIAASTALAQFTINTPPNPTQCQPLLINWTGGVPPYFLTIHPGADPTGPAILSFPPIYGTQTSWFCNLPARTSIGFNLRDSTGTVAQSAAVSIQDPAPGVTCDTTTFSFTAQTSGTAGSGSTSTGTNPSPATTTTPSGKTATTGSSTSGTASAGANSSAASATSTKSAAASRTTGQIAAGIIGAAMVALLG